MTTHGQIINNLTKAALGNTSLSSALEATQYRSVEGTAELLQERISLWLNARPSEVRRATGQVILNLWLNPKGLSKKSLMELSDAELSKRSFQYALSFEAALNKRIQRARSRVVAFGFDIVFDRKAGVWKLAAC